MGSDPISRLYLGASSSSNAPSDNEGREFLSSTVQKLAPDRDDVQTIFDLLDLDDFVSFGGAA